MKFELDAEHDILYIESGDSDAERTVDLDDGVHMDLDAEGRVLGLEFLSLEAFRDFLDHRNGSVTVPEWLRNEAEISQLLGSRSMQEKGMPSGNHVYVFAAQSP